MGSGSASRELHSLKYGGLEIGGFFVLKEPGKAPDRVKVGVYQLTFYFSVGRLSDATVLQRH